MTEKMTMTAEPIKKREELSSGKNIGDMSHNEMRRAVAERVYAKTKNFNSEHCGYGPTNKEHHNLMVETATELNVHFDVVALACAEWSHEFDYTPPPPK